MVVMDPLSKPLSCPCVEGYAQRDYEQLAAYLSERTGYRVTAAFSESLLIGARRKRRLEKPTW